MHDTKKTKKQLLAELEEARQRLAQLETARQLPGNHQQERRQTTWGRRKTDRALQVLSECNNALLYATDESSLLNEICRVIVEDGGYRLAWVGYAENDPEKTVRPVAYLGDEQHYLDTIKISWADVPHGQGPTGIAIRTSRPSTARHILTNPNYQPWREQAIERGYASSIALPLASFGDRPLGALNIYATEPESFDRDEVTLLMKLADNLAYGITALRERAERERTEAALRESEARYQHMFQRHPAIMLLVDTDVDRIVDANPAACQFYGYDHQTLVGMKVNQINAFTPQQIDEEIYHAAEQNREYLNFPHRLASGETRQVEVRSGPVVSGGQILRYSIIHDVTARQQAETERERLLVAEREQRLQAETLTEVALALTSQLSLGAVLDEVLKQVRRIVPFETANIRLLDDNVLYLANQQGYDAIGAAEAIDDMTLPLKHFPLDRAVIEANEPVVIGDTHQEPRWVIMPETPWIRSVILLPITSHNDVLGILQLDSDKIGAFTLEDVQRLQPLVNAAAVALENAQLYEQAQWEIAERMRVEKREAVLGRILDNSLNEIYIFDASTLRFINVNQGARRNLGYPMGDLMRLTPLDLKPEITPELFQQLLHPLRTGEQDRVRFFTVHRRKDNSEYPVEVTIQPSVFESALVFIANIVDISERVEAENRLHQSEVRYRQMFEEHAAIMMITDAETWQIVDANKAACEFYGYDHQTLTAMTIYQLNRITKEEINRRAEHAERARRSLISTRHYLASDEVRDVEIRFSQITSEGRELNYAVIHDVTERRRAEAQLHLQANVLEAAANGIAITDCEGTILWINPAFTTLTGYTAEEAIGENPRILKSGQHDQPFYKHLWDTVLSGEVWRGEIINRRKDGILYTEEQTITPVFDEQGEITHFIAIKQNITTRRQAEEAIRTQNEQLRRLTARLAEAEEAEREWLARELHDQTGQALTVLGINLNIVQAQMPSDADPIAQTRLDDSLVLVEQITEQVRHMITDLRSPVLDDYGLLAALRWYGKQIILRTGTEVIVRGTKLDPPLKPVVANALFRIAQEALTNVAKHAQANRVTLSIETSADTLCLTIEDDGIGFTPSRSHRLSEDSGWGIITMSERAEAVGGHCLIESNPQKGTKITVEVAR